MFKIRNILSVFLVFLLGFNGSAFAITFSIDNIIDDISLPNPDCTESNGPNNGFVGNFRTALDCVNNVNNAQEIIVNFDNAPSGNILIEQQDDYWEVNNDMIFEIDDRVVTFGVDSSANGPGGTALFLNADFLVDSTLGGEIIFQDFGVNDVGVDDIKPPLFYQPAYTQRL